MIFGINILEASIFYHKDHKEDTKITKDYDMDIEVIFKEVLDIAFRVHKRLGPGLLESAYEACLFYELQNNGLQVERQKPLPLVYEKVKLEAGYRVDLIVEKKVIIEVKAVESLAEVHLAQILTYLKLSGCQLGLLANFNVAYLKDGIRRVIQSSLRP